MRSAVACSVNPSGKDSRNFIIHVLHVRVQLFSVHNIARKLVQLNSRFDGEKFLDYSPLDEEKEHELHKTVDRFAPDAMD